MKRAAKNVVKRLEQYQQAQPDQLALFQEILDAGEAYSNTIALYDFIPKYFHGNATRINGQFLPTLERQFPYKDAITGEEVKYTVQIFPARIKNGKGEEKDYYPGEREEFVEDALRKLACDRTRGYFLDDEAGVVFTLYELQEELQKNGHTYNLNQIKEALLICARTGVELYVASGDGKSTLELSSSLFDTVGLATRDDWKGHGKEARCFVRFNWLVTQCIKNGTFRPINYEKSMRLKKVIARHLFKRMSHHYTQASLDKPYTILLSTVIRLFGLTSYKDTRNNWRQLKEALEELKTADVVLSYEQVNVYDEKRKNKIADVKITIKPDPRFTGEMRKFNAINRDMRQQLPDDVHRARVERQRDLLLGQGRQG